LTAASCPAGFSTSGVNYTTATNPSAAALQAARPLNLKYPYYSYIYTVGNPDNSNYNGAQMTLTQRPTHGLSYTLGFTYAHALDMATSERGGPTNTPGAFRSDYSSSEFDIRKRFTGTVTYAVPGKKGFAQMLEGWKLTSIITAQSGLPWGAAGDSGVDLAGQTENVDRWNFSGDPANFSGLGRGSVPCFGVNGSVFAVPNCTTVANVAALPAACVSAAASQVTLARFGCYLSGDAVMTPPAYGSYGNLTRNTFRGNTFTAWDGSVIKNFKFTERLAGEFRFEIFNLLNHVNYGNPQFNGGGSTDPFTPANGFGTSNNTPDVANNNPSLGSGGPREFQMGFRLSF
jgi:hypothetical protein